MAALIRCSGELCEGLSRPFCKQKTEISLTKWNNPLDTTDLKVRSSKARPSVCPAELPGAPAVPHGLTLNFQSQDINLGPQMTPWKTWFIS